ncbi:MAG: hypothetical protein HY735_25125 [Verrucomicrobia bacterium]|nr:hypothetical protein [Verrucomicrobiota bacterium]
MPRSWIVILKPVALAVVLPSAFCEVCVAQLGGFSAGTQIGQVTRDDLTEISGIAASRHNPGVLWIHNDRSRDRLYAVRTNGQFLATYNLGKDVNDFEDLAIGPGPLPEFEYLYCGDIGDNSATRSNIRVYRAPEPAVYAYFAANPPSENFPIVEKITLVYPDGSFNAEALMIDPLTGDLYIATKQPNLSRIYRAASSQLQDEATVTLSFVVELNFHEVSSGDISADGQEIILRQEDFARMWTRAPGESLAEVLAGIPIDIPVIGRPTEPNGEGVAFHGSGLGYYTISEGENPVIYFFATTGSPPLAVTRTLLPPGSTWRFSDGGMDQGTTWRNPSFADATWRTGPAQLGYGEDDEQTVVSFGADKDRKHVTTYFRTQFPVENPVPTGTLTLSAVFDDGIAVYLNGIEVLRRNLAPNAAFADAALASGSSLENLWQSFVITNLLRAGSNTMAVEVHRRSESEGDLSFDLQLQTGPGGGALQFSGPPRRVAGAGWALDFCGPVGATISVEGSANLDDWASLGSVILRNGAGSLTNLQPAGAPWNFYRLRQ